LEDKAIKINDKNFSGLSELSAEFGFHALSGKLSDRQRSPALIDSQAAECRARISALEERTEHHDDQLEVLQTMLSNALKRFETDLMRLATEVKAVRDAQNSDSPLPAASAPPPTAPAADDARNRDRTLPVAAEAPPSSPAKKSKAAAKHRSRQKKSPPPSAPAKNSKAAGVPSVPAQPVRLDSLIVREYPPLLDEFRMKCFNLLWRGSRDGFTAEEFHRRCDGRANTLTVILDTDGSVFGGFTPVEWESRTWNGKSGKESNTWKGDHSLRSFLFTLRNPHGVPPRKLALRKEMKEYAIVCDSDCCAVFGDCSVGCQLIARNNCNCNEESCARIGSYYRDTTYENDTRFRDFFTREMMFRVKEIEVFEIT
jgi:uncharacterized coiled-coil protein SlyX